MYFLETWDIYPIFSITAALVWCALDMVLDSLHISHKLSNKFSWKERTVKKWLRGICCVVAHAVVFLLLLLLSSVTGVDLFSRA